MDWSVLTNPDLGDDARAALAKLDRDTRTHLSQALGTIVNKKLEEMIRPWFSRGSHDWAEVDVHAAQMRDGGLVLHFIADHYNYNFAQSGSDWADHYVFVGEATLAGGKREHQAFALEQHIHLSEHESAGYDRRKILDTVRAQMRAKLRGEMPGKAAFEEAVAGASPSGDSHADDPRRKPGTKAAAWVARWHKTLGDDAAHFEWQRLTAAGSECERAKEYGKAAEHYEAAAKLAERSGPPHNVYLGRALFRLAWVRNRGAGGTVDTSLYTRALAILEKNLDYPGVVSGLAGEMTVWCSQKDPAEAERLGKRFLPVVERTHGLLHEDTSELVLKLGHALRLQHKHAEADQLYDRWLQAAEAAWGPVDFREIHVIEDMARNFRSEGSTSKAESMYGRALTMAEMLHSDQHARIVLLELGTLYGEQGRYAEAEKLLRRCWSKAEASDTEVAEALADVLRKTGREKEAVEIRGGAVAAFSEWVQGDYRE